jgi:hypothetical protein
MDFNTTIDIIIKDLREAREIIDDLKHYPGVPKIQVELAKSKCKSAEEIIALLKTMKQEFQSPSDQRAGVIKVTDVVEDVKVIKSTKPLRPDVLIEINDKEESQSFIATVNSKKEPEIISLPVKEKPVKEDDTVIRKKSKGKKPDKNIVADKFSRMSNTFNEQLGNIKTEGDISAVIKSRPVHNLIEAIGINDKFLFIREIFSGDQLSYNEAIAKLNKVDNLSDAKAVIMSYTGEGDENEAVKQLLDLVKRKLPADE